MKEERTIHMKSEQETIEDWCHKDGKAILEEVQEETESLIEIFGKAQLIDPKELQKPCTI